MPENEITKNQEAIMTAVLSIGMVVIMLLFLILILFLIHVNAAFFWVMVVMAFAATALITLGTVLYKVK